MAKGATPKVNVPQYQRPTPDSFSSPYGNVTYGNGGFNYNQSPEDQAFTTQLQATRNALLKTIGSTSQDQTNALNEWQKTYFDEANRLSQPQLEGSLFDRGLGGSNFYGGALNDLITKNANQSILNKYTLASQDQANRLNNFNAIDSAYNTGNQNAYNLLSLATNAAGNQDSLATSRYQATLPYLVTYDGGRSGNGYGGLIGGVLGGAAGSFGGPGGAIMGAQIGSGIGGGIDAGMGNESVGSQIYNPILQTAGYGAGLNNLAGYNLPGFGYGGMLQPRPKLSAGNASAFGRAGTLYKQATPAFLRGY